MRVLKATLAAAVVLGLAGAAASAQSLGELADKEKQKRQGKPAPKPITEDDLARAGKKGTLSMTASPRRAGGRHGPGCRCRHRRRRNHGRGDDRGRHRGRLRGCARATPRPSRSSPRDLRPRARTRLRAEAKADVQKKLDAARTNLANHQLVLAQIEQVLNASATYGEVLSGPGRPDQAPGRREGGGVQVHGRDRPARRDAPPERLAALSASSLASVHPGQEPTVAVQLDGARAKSRLEAHACLSGSHLDHSARPRCFLAFKRTSTGTGPGRLAARTTRTTR